MMSNPAASVIVISPPDPILTLAEIKRQLGIDSCDTASDPLLDALGRAAQWELEPPSWVGRAFGQQVLELRLDETAWFADSCSCTGQPASIVLPYPPLALDAETGAPLVESVKYLDANNVLQTLPVEAWRVTGAGGTGVAKIALAYGQAWPTTLADPEAIRVRFTAGFALGDPNLIPAKQAMLLAIGQMKSLARDDILLTRENVPGVGTQEWALSAEAGSIVRSATDRLLAKYWVPVG
jgi:hypothetical protein